jgi:hypothetical protein
LDWMSAVTQNRPLKVEIKGFKTGHFWEVKTVPLGLVSARPSGHVECPESEPANDDIQFSRSGLVPATDCPGAWDQPGDGWPVFAVKKTIKTSHFDPRRSTGIRVLPIKLLNWKFRCGLARLYLFTRKNRMARKNGLFCFRVDAVKGKSHTAIGTLPVTPRNRDDVIIRKSNGVAHLASCSHKVS